MSTPRAVADHAVSSRAAQGLPPTITDPHALRRVALILASAAKRGTGASVLPLAATDLAVDDDAA